MAQLRNIQRANPLSAFDGAGPTPGLAFRALGDTLDHWNKQLAPLAKEEQKEIGRKRGLAAAAAASAAMGSVAAPDQFYGSNNDGGLSAIRSSLRQTESGGNPSALNAEGYGGLVQMGSARLQDAYKAGVIPTPMTGAEYAQLSEEEQERIEDWHFSDLDRYMQNNELYKYVGSTINGTQITQGSIIAMAHLGGAAGAKQYLESGGAYNPADSNGTSLSDYAARHAGVNQTGQVSDGDLRPHGRDGGDAGADWLVYNNQNAIRNDPLSDDLLGALSFLPEMGVTMEVFSGGQENNTSSGTGSTRHNHGDAADAVFYQNGRQIDWSDPEDRPIFEAIIEEAAARGVTGIGVGPGYMRKGSVHVGFGNEAVWGAGGSGANAPQWAKDAHSRGVSRRNGEPAAVVRNDQGQLEPVRYSPLSGPALQAHNAASNIAYLAASEEQAQLDIMNLSLTYPNDPNGFMQATQAYIDQRVSLAPQNLRDDLRATLSTEARRRFEGLTLSQHKEMRIRAERSTGALVDRYANDLADALVAGREEDAAAARTRLENVLYAREKIPQTYWTREQSENVLIETFSKAETEIAKQQKKAETERRNETEDRLGIVIDAAKSGRSSAFDALVDDPQIAAENPELAQEARAWVSFRERFPGFYQMTPDQQADAIQQETSRPRGTDWDGGFLPKMIEAHEESLKQLKIDPIGFAQEKFRDKPVELPTMEEVVSDPGSIARAVKERVRYGEDMVRDGYTDNVRIFSTAERESLSKIFSADVAPEAQYAMAEQILKSAGQYAPSALVEMGAPRGFVHASAVTAAGGSEAVLREYVIGQQMIAENVIDLPKPSAISTAAQSVMNAAMPPTEVIAPGMRADVIDVAKGLYAARGAGLDPESEEAAVLLADSVQRALGRVEYASGKYTGGVQSVNGQPTLLPPGYLALDVERSLRRALTFTQGGEIEAGDTELRGSRFYRNDSKERLTLDPNPQAFGPAGVPLYRGQPINSAVLREARLIPMQGRNGIIPGRYFMTLNGIDVTTTDGALYEFDLSYITRSGF